LKTKRIYFLIFLSFIIISNCNSSSRLNIQADFQTEKKKLEIHVINVGQGDCFLIIAPSGKKVLIDGGNTGRGAAVVLPYLKNLGITSLDYIIATHYHLDHIGGLDEVVNGLGGSSQIIKAVFDRGDFFNSGDFREYASAIRDKRKTILPGQIIYLDDDVLMTCIASSGKTLKGQVYWGRYENILSVVMILKFHFFDMYFGGDSDIYIEPSLIPVARDVDVYKVSHHGSAVSSSQQLLDCLKPEVSVISVGNGNHFGHPDTGTLSRLIAIGSYIYQTESGAAVPIIGKGEVSNGSFTIISDGDSYTISGGSLVTATRLTDEKIAAPENKKHSYVWTFLSKLILGFEAPGGRIF
jgi:competence protein ComEC